MQKLEQPFYTDFLVGAMIADELSYLNALKGTMFEHHKGAREIRHHVMSSPVVDRSISMLSVKGQPHYVILSEWLGHGIVTVEYLGGKDRTATTYTGDACAKLLMDLRIHLGLRSDEGLLEPFHDSTEPSRAE